MLDDFVLCFNVALLEDILSVLVIDKVEFLIIVSNVDSDPRV